MRVEDEGGITSTVKDGQGFYSSSTNSFSLVEGIKSGLGSTFG